MKRLLKRMFGAIMGRKHMPPQKTLAAAISELTTSNGHVWQAVEGVFSYPAVTKGANASINVDVGNVIVTKLFIDTVTGELRAYPAKVFGWPDVAI